MNRSLAVLQAMTDAPKELTKELDKPFAERVLEPLPGARAARSAAGSPAADSGERIRHKLDLAGNPAGLDRRPGGRRQGDRRRRRPRGRRSCSP